MNPHIARLITHFGTQQQAAETIGVDQTTISGWLRGKHSISIANAVRIQVVTSGAIQAIELCPLIAQLSPTLNQMMPQISAPDQSGKPSVNSYSAEATR